MQNEQGERIWILVIEHRHGSDAWVSRTEAGIYAKAAEYCREWWEDSASPDDEPPIDDAECVDIYFDSNTEEFYNITSAELEAEVDHAQ